MKNNTIFTGLPYWLGGVALGLLNIVVFMLSEKPWGITTAMSHWGAEFSKFFGAAPEQWLYFGEIQMHNHLTEYQPFLIGTLLNIGIIFGAMFAALIYHEFRIRRPRNIKQVMAALLGGLFMGYGARLAGGCSVGALVGGSASLSLHGWVFGIFLLPGAWLGLKVISRYLTN
ncbi:YeeE/YedE family protein [Metallumcola ferriviriculae]|uniref:YeeE/YedE family protein n=1 Tax=Metallumcola ferriviriculae TaxID=3039180 RepID=A0AAU0USD8_9FIRM|nr:YeeE/YedE family protein [Desulfitibacteraceae bacterium MK1]